jgi:hypothetical protein
MPTYSLCPTNKVTGLLGCPIPASFLDLEMPLRLYIQNSIALV